MPGILVAGFGNSLLGDDGAGLAVVEELNSRPLPSGVKVIRGETDSLNLPNYWSGEQEIWLVDSIWRNSPPGTIHFLEHEEVLSISQKHATAHQLSLPESIRWINLVYPDMARVVYELWAIEPESIELRNGLSTLIVDAVIKVADEIEKKAGERSQS